MPFDPGKMPAVARHVFVCTAEPCGGNGGEATYKALKKRAKHIDGVDGVWVNRSGSVGGCLHGPMVVIYPEGVWYHSVTVDKVDELIRRHFIAGEIITEWLFHRTEHCPGMPSAPGQSAPG